MYLPSLSKGQVWVPHEDYIPAKGAKVRARVILGECPSESRHSLTGTDVIYASYNRVTGEYISRRQCSESLFYIWVQRYQASLGSMEESPNEQSTNPPVSCIAL